LEIRFLEARFLGTRFLEDRSFRGSISRDSILDFRFSEARFWRLDSRLDSSGLDSWTLDFSGIDFWRIGSIGFLVPIYLLSHNIHLFREYAMTSASLVRPH